MKAKTKAELIIENRRLRTLQSIGQDMSNVVFNYQNSKDLPSFKRLSKRLLKKWDAAVRS